jgi:hypothetical protein
MFILLPQVPQRERHRERERERERELLLSDMCSAKAPSELAGRRCSALTLAARNSCLSCAFCVVRLCRSSLWESERETHAHRHRRRHRHRHTDADTDTERHTQTHTHTRAQTQTQTERHTRTQTHTQKHTQTRTRTHGHTCVRQIDHVMVVVCLALPCQVEPRSTSAAGVVTSNRQKRGAINDDRRDHS